jgi:uncharacterized protein (TIGR03086 family)
MRTIEELDALAVRASVTVVSQARAADLGRATPCSEWDLGALLKHMITQHRGFAAAARGRGADPAVWRPRPLDADFVREYAAAADDVLDAFAKADGPFSLPELSTDREFPGRQAMSFHFIDYVAHGWDVAQSLDVTFALPEDVLTAALPIARAVPDGEPRLAPGAAFAPSLPVGPDADPLTQVMALLGRNVGGG